jgi:regulator of protease activity HflC (stomatin/prohibitin superfamily)
MGIEQFIGSGAVYLALAIFLIVTIFKAVRIVPQSEKYVVERFGRLRSVLGPGINFLVPYLDRVAHKVSVLERQLPNARQDAISADNVLLQVETSVFYRVTEPEKTVYRIRDIDAAIATTVTGIVRSEIGKLELDQVEILDVALDEQTRNAMLQQLNAERARRAQVMEAEGKKRAVELGADADLYAADQAAKARRLTADAEAYATGVIAGAIKENGLEAAQFQVALKQVEALQAIAAGAGKQTILVPANALEAFGDAFKMLKGRA